MPRRVFGSIRKLPSGRYQASYTGPDGRRHKGWSTYLSEGDAGAWLRDEEVLIDRAEWTPPAHRNPVTIAAPMTLREYAEGNLKRRATRLRRPIKPTTVDNYRKLLDLCILPELGRYALVDVTPAIVRRWYDALPTRNPTQNGNGYDLLRSMMSDAVEDDLIPRNPVKIKGAGKPAPKRTGEALNLAELHVYLLHAERHALPLMLAAWCALRSGEVRGLRRCDVADDGGAVRVAQTVSRIGQGRREWYYGTPKSAAGARTIAVPPHLRDLLRGHIEAMDGGPNQLLFPASDGVHPLPESVLREAHKKAAEAINRPSLTIHDLRRTGATLAGQTGATVKELMLMLGHTQPTVAMLYQVADAKRDNLRAERMSELLSHEVEDTSQRPLDTY